MSKKKHSEFVKLIVKEIMQEDKVLSQEEWEKINSSGSKTVEAERENKLRK